MKLKSAFLATTAILAAGNALAADVSVYGQVNKLAVSADNGVESNTEIVDNDASSTRFGFKVNQQLENGLVASALLELQSEANSSSSTDFGDDESNQDGQSISERHSRVGLGGSFGTVLIGRTSESTDGISEQDLGGVADVMYSDLNAVGGSIHWRKKSDGTEIGVSGSEKDLNDLYSNLDGGRTNLVRYDTPVVNGVQGSVSVASGGDIAVAAKYKGKIDRFAIKAGVGIKKHESSDDVKHDISGSASIKCEESGVAATVAMGQRSHEAAGRKDGEFLYTKLSYAPVNSKMEYAIDYGTSESISADKEEVTSYGVGTQYNLAKGVSTSLMYRQFEADKLSDEVEDIKVISAGLKVKF